MIAIHVTYRVRILTQISSEPLLLTPRTFGVRCYWLPELLGFDRTQFKNHWLTIMCKDDSLQPSCACRCFEVRCKNKNHTKSDCINYFYNATDCSFLFFYLNQKKINSLFFFYCENSFTAAKDFYFIEYRLKWLFKCKRLATPDLYTTESINNFL